MIAEISSQLAGNGLILRGGFAFAPGEDAPADARAVLLVGHGGPSIWPHFEAWRERQPPDLADPLDTWSREKIGEVAARFGARAVSPSDRPYLPFQQWAMRAEGLRPSPLGILMHPEFGLWHAYRGALLFEDPDAAREIGQAARPAHAPIHLCDGCDGKPCLKSCPVGAHSAAGFAYESCLAHVRSPRGAACRQGGCLDRNACPYGATYRYPAAQQVFHMRAFAG
ncbi:hypothetical protein [Mesorhizobium sp. J428]|uniref:hypothetical protein n=1 Tax=Mesorhizobium sp. J428 TaxID=2898440 RepID=UPI00215089FE|nr:hypothetical protein [Mesorhizobium sp. J428]MCR5855289.1 hypothetical protein [Mesorhizobium sp. J428]